MSQFQLDLGYQFKSLRNRSKSISAVESAAKSRGAVYGELGGDFFNALFQKHPQLKADIAEDNKYNQVLRALSQSPRFQQIRAQTKGNLNWSAIGAAMLLDEISKQVDFSDEPPPEPEKSEESQDQEKEKNKSDDQTDDKGQQPSDESDNEDESEDGDEGDKSGEPSENGSDSDKDIDEDSEPDNEGDSADSDSDDGESQSEEPTNDNPNDSDPGDNEPDDMGDNESEESGEPTNSGDNGDEGDIDDDWDFEDEDNSLEDGPPKPIAQAIQDAIDNAADKMDEMISGIKAGQGSAIPGGDSKMVDDYVRLSTNPNLVKLMRMVGRLKLDVNFLSALSASYPEENMGVTLGNNIKRTLPRDLARLAGDDDEFMVFLGKYQNRELLQRKYRANNRPGKGPMIVCVDVSSSMASHGRYEWAQTIAAAMYTMAHKEGRPFAAIPYNDGARLYQAQPKGNAMDVNLLASILGFMPRGGTNFDAAWRVAIGFMRKQAATSKWKNADIVFITDGECGFDKEEWLKDKDKLNVRLFSFLIGMDEKEAHSLYDDEWLANHPASARYIAKSLMGTPVHSDAIELEKASDAMVYVDKLDTESESQAFHLVKSAQQKRGQIVK